ncbi:MAG TPA: protein kinase, partial [Chthonomonadaceae bacterium]|nr:protein kinase [Chthonomonadaceae bacterium]
MPLTPNQQIGPYTLIRPLGEGGFGVVWLAERRGLITTQVALKMPRDRSDAIVQEVTQEAQVWQQASGHPNVLPVIECAIYDGHVVIVSEYVADGTLADWFARCEGRATPIEEAVRITDGILAGLEHLHRLEITHRDLKPANVMLQGNMPRLTDFGLARGKAIGQTQSITGSLHYMAPEMFSGDYSPQSDLWAAGVILYELLTGRLPFPQERVEMLIPAIVGSEPAAMPAAIPAGLRRVVERALVKKPEGRWRSAAEMRAALVAGVSEAVSTPPSEHAARRERVALLYKRDAEPDERVLRLLEESLESRGHAVFIDQHLAVGIEWAREIERQIRDADAVVPLISAASIQSEMLAYELKIAQEALLREGKPRLLPVRVRFAGRLSGELGEILNRVHYASWSGPEDDGRLTAEIGAAVERTAQPAAAAPAPKPMEAVGGAVNLDSSYWIVRPTEMQFRDAIARGDSIVLLKGARQMGKTSLLARG